MATPSTARKTTRRARPTCGCPLCAGTVATANGVYPCRADTTIEYIIVNAGEYLGTRATEMLAKTELNSYRRDQLMKPIEQAAAEADIEAEVAEFIAEVAAANPLDDEAYQMAQLAEAMTAGQDHAVDAYLDAVLDGNTERAAELLAELQATPSLSERNQNFIRYVTPVPPAEPLTPRMLFPIYPTADGFAWSGAPESYTDYTTADLARAEWLARA